MDRERDWGAFLAAIRSAAILTGRTGLTQEALDMYFDVMRGYSIEQVRYAVEAHLCSSEGRFFPTPSHLILQIDGSAQERANYAWRVLLKALGRYGYYDSVRFPNPAYHYAIGLLGGWPKVSETYGAMDERELNFRRSEFLTLYQRGERVSSFSPEGGKETVPAYLPGAFELNNRAGGYDDCIPPVVDVATGEKTPQAALASGGGKSLAAGLASLTGRAEVQNARERPFLP